MRRSTKSLFKFAILSGFTISFTVVTFKLLRKIENGYNENVQLPVQRKGDMHPESLKVNVFVNTYIYKYNK